MMRILHVTQALYPDMVGGSPIGIHLVATAEKRAGHDVTVETIAYKRPQATAPPPEYLVHRHRKLPMPWDFLGTAGNPLAPSFSRTVRISGADIVHLHSHLFFPTFFGLRGARKASIPSILTVHGVIARRGKLVTALQNLWIKTFGEYVFRRVDIVATQTDADCRLLQTYGVPATKIRVLFNACNEEVFYPGARPRGKQVIWVGRHVKEKAVDVLLAAWKKVVETEPAARLVLVGDGPERSASEALAQEYGVADSVLFIPLAAPAEVATLLREASLFVLPSRREGFPMALLEAMACARPIITTEGLRELGDIAAYIPADDPGALVAAVLNDLRNPSAAEQRGQRAWGVLRDRYSVAKLAEAYEGLYREAIQLHEDHK